MCAPSARPDGFGVVRRNKVIRILNEREISRARKLREVDGLTYKVLGVRFGVSGVTVQKALKARTAEDEAVGENVGDGEIRT
jgi:hypothetical protein